MSKLIIKSPFYQCGKQAVSGMVGYIATRDRVELLPDNTPVQVPEAGQDMDRYMQYIATRPRAERLGAHGLFGDDDHVDLKKTMAELDAYTGNVWGHVISLRREDATRLGYDNAHTWRNLLRAHRNDVAAAMKIPPENFRWFAAFHDEGEHPHVHMMAWSTDPKQGYLNKNGIREIRSTLTNEIFQQEMLCLYQQKSISRDDLVQEARQAMAELTRQMKTGICSHPEVESLVLKLSEKLETVKGKKQYGYLPKPMKELVDKIVDQMAQVDIVAECYEKWQELQEQVQSHYTGDVPERKPLSQQKEFQAIKNAVIREAARLQLDELTFEDVEQTEEHLDESDVAADYHHLKQIISDPNFELEYRDRAAEGMKRLAEEGDWFAQYQMGKLYRDGTLLSPDAPLARHYLEQAAERGLMAAQYALGVLYLSGDPAVHSPEHGIAWLKVAAENGSDRASYRLGKEYLRGKVLEKDVRKGLDHLACSADAGNQFAQYMLGKLYLFGKEVERDSEQAEHWLSLSAAHGNNYAQLLLDRWDAPKPAAALSVCRLLHHFGSIFQDKASSYSRPNGLQIESKLRQRMMEKKQALGQKQEQGLTMSY